MGKEETKLPLFTSDVIFVCGKPQKFHKITIRSNKFSKVRGFSEHRKISLIFYTITMNNVRRKLRKHFHL